MKVKQSDYIQLDGVDIVNLINDKQVSKKEVLDASFRQLDEVNERLNATTHVRRELPYNEINELTDGSPFHGLPIFLKDISQSLKGSPLTGGSRLLKDVVAPETAHFVQQM